ncbi:MAG: 2-C-methyl-D-erythritol 2,4-cyclodiphosphate synthase [Bacteroidales bacterium]|nr:2-C-methyl-D-erythritol 2,4-cyclodiphosphate synthase [Bacteroidales bacterium]MBR4716093.1 2-C-methyl-D-erythritol 2,4-cyclodiphosphate synthase [Bacteroidales bacterium]MCR4931516.1 2-C-methyl-D-erythritol 2,4-cyclodiphosphate synthase [Bacteroidales bacterium]
MKIRTGIGYDVHQLKEGLPLWLGGIQVPHTKGLVGHSDADVLIHAICDALLGAAALGDIGQHFPDTDPAYKGIDSKVLLKNVCRLLGEKGYTIGNVDAILCMQKPKVASYIPVMRQTLAETMDISLDDISVKATTTEHLGFEGREEGISAIANVLITKR